MLTMPIDSGKLEILKHKSGEIVRYASGGSKKSNKTMDNAYVLDN